MEECKCSNCPAKPDTYEEWIFRKSSYSTVCPNAYEEVAKHCNGEPKAQSNLSESPNQAA